MSALTDFLLARIAEKQAGAPAEHYQPFEREWEWCPALDGGDCECSNPRRRARVLAECAAMRQQIAHLIDFMEGDYAPWNEDQLKMMAGIWSDHPDFDPGWAL